MEKYLEINNLKANIRRTIYNKKTSKLYLLSRYRKELSKLWPIIYKKQYLEKFYGIHAKKWLTTKRYEAVFIINISHCSHKDEMIKLLEKTDLVFHEEQFKKIETITKSGSDEKTNSSQSLTIIEMNDEALLKLLKEHKIFLRFSGNIEKLIGDPSKKLLEEHEEKEVLDLLHKVID